MTVVENVSLAGKVFMPGSFGRAVGIEEGRAKEKHDIARNLRSLGVTLNDISKATGLTAEEIEAL